MGEFLLQWGYGSEVLLASSDLVNWFLAVPFPYNNFIYSLKYFTYKSNIETSNSEGSLLTEELMIHSVSQIKSNINKPSWASSNIQILLYLGKV